MSGENGGGGGRRDGESRRPPADTEHGANGDADSLDLDPDVLWRAQSAFSRVLRDDDVPLPDRNRLSARDGGGPARDDWGPPPGPHGPPEDAPAGDGEAEDGPLLPDLSAIAEALSQRSAPDSEGGDAPQRRAEEQAEEQRAGEDDSLLPDLSAIAAALTGAPDARDDTGPAAPPAVQRRVRSRPLARARFRPAGQDPSSTGGSRGTITAVARPGRAGLLQAAIRHHRAGREALAMDGYRRVLARDPDEAAAWVNLGALLRRAGKVEAAIVCLSRGLTLEPQDGPAWSNLGNALRAAGRLEEAHRAHTRALDLAPGAPQLHYNFGLAARDFGSIDDARRAFRRAELLGYDKPDLAVDMALTELLAGDLAAGFSGYEARWRLPGNAPRRAEIPLWEGDAPKGRRILVCHEQGLNDAIQFARYAPRLAALGAEVLLEAPAALRSLLAASPDFADIDLVDPDGPAPDADFRIPLASLPGRFPLDDASLGAGAPYLDAPDASRTHADGLLRIGLVWSDRAGDASGALTLDRLTGLLDLPVAEFHSLQTGPARGRLAETGLDAIVQDDGAAIGDCASMAQAIAGLDLVIGVDSAAIHLAGATGRPAWLLLPFAPDWRWRLHRGDSPWYPSLTLFRQTSPGDWDELVGRVRHALLQEARRRLGEPAGA